MKTLWRSVAAVLLLTLVVVGFAPASPALAAPAPLAQNVAPILLVNTSFLNVRSGPGAQYTTVLTVVGGTELPVLGVAKDKIWYYVATAVGNGWVNVSYVLPRGDFTYVPQIDTSGIVAGVALVASGPVTIGMPAFQSQGVPLGQGGGGPAPAQAQGIPLSTGTFVKYRARVMTSSLDVFNAPSQRAGNFTTLFRNDQVDYAIVGATSNEGISWLQIVVPKAGTGWVEAEKIFKALSGAVGTVMTVSAKTIAVDLDGGGAAILVEGEEVFLLGNAATNRLYVELGDGRRGTMPFDSVVQRVGSTTDGLVGQGGLGQGGGGNPPPPAGGAYLPTVPMLEAPVAIVNTGAVNIRLGPGGDYDSIAVIPGGVQLTILGYAKDQVWFLVQGDFGQGWVNRDFILIRGDLDNAALIKDAYTNGSVAVG